jgi:acylphosphatase
MVSRHLQISGRVQGVGFRYSMQKEATRLGLSGWVRNRRDGSVEAVFSGPADAITAMIAACRRGPSSARVDAVQDEAANPDMLNLREAGDRFSVLPTI